MGAKLKSKISRRDFLKIAGSLGLISITKNYSTGYLQKHAQTLLMPNIIILIFDALSAYHLSLYGYKRQTCPNIELFAERATVYHNHHSTANFTTPSTASLLTGTYPWQHKVFTLMGAIDSQIVPYNVFRFLKSKYFTAAYTQNRYADKLLFQFEEDINHHQPADSFNSSGIQLYNKLPEDEVVTGLRSLDDFLFQETPPRGSLFFSILNNFYSLIRHRIAYRKIADLYPIGMPNLPGNYVFFTLDQVIDGVMKMLGELPKPFFSYIHLMPPHFPYLPNRYFYRKFNDHWEPEAKPRHPLGDLSRDNFPNKRRRYDEYIANLDHEFGRLMDYLKSSGLMDNSYIFLTSDHGELFERGHHGHLTPMLFEPLLRVPLLISSPGHLNHKDIYYQTSNIDILPTLLEIANIQPPSHNPGQAITNRNGKTNPKREIWSLERKYNSASNPWQTSTLALIKDFKKLVYYKGYKHYKDQYEFYDISNDPEELNNLYPIGATELQSTMEKKLSEISGE